MFFLVCCLFCFCFFFFKQKTAYEMRISDWSSDVCSSDLDMRDWRRYRGYDWNRYEPGYSYYYADRYYRDGRYYQPRRLTRADRVYRGGNGRYRSEEHTSELQSLMRISYAVFCLKKKKKQQTQHNNN